ncbi:MAG: GFA family protein [Gammaproteobacteria bacterium]
MTQAKLTGSCLCGSVQYEITGEPKRFYHCHCSRCRKASGTGHASNLIVELGAVRWTAGEELIGGYKVPEAERLPLAPQARIFWDSRVSWSCSGDDLPVFAEYPPAQ